MKLFTGWFEDGTLDVKDGIHVHEGDEKSPPYIELGMPDRIGPYSKVPVDRDLFNLIPRRFVECPKNGTLPDRLTDGKLICDECGVTLDEARLARRPNGAEALGIPLNDVFGIHDTIDVPSRLMEAEATLLAGRKPFLTEDQVGDTSRIGVLFVARAGEDQLCWIELQRTDRKLYQLHQLMIGTSTEEGVSQERLVVMRPGDEVRIMRKTFGTIAGQVFRDPQSTEAFTIVCDRELRLHVRSRTVEEHSRKENPHVEGAEAVGSRPQAVGRDAAPVSQLHSDPTR